MSVIFLLWNVIMINLLTNATAKPFYEKIDKVIVIFDSDISDSNTNILRSKNSGEKQKTPKEVKAELKKANLVKNQHQRKMREVIEFMKNHMVSTNYFYDEMKRIKEQRRVKGPLRDMIDWLEKYNHNREMRRVIKFYIKVRRDYALQHFDVWSHKPNKLKINIVNDAFNDG